MSVYLMRDGERRAILAAGATAEKTPRQRLRELREPAGRDARHRPEMQVFCWPMRTVKKTGLLLLLVVLAAVISGQSNPARRRAVQPSAPPPPAPIANADTYTLNRGATLTITAANGVLANDSDPQSKPLTASLVTSTTHGTLTLGADGGFSYANDSSAATTDSFTYRANNGTSSSAIATVTFVINADTPPVAAADTFNLTSATA